MARSDYAHWNEDADYMWWQEEGRHVEEAPEPEDDRFFDEGEPGTYGLRADLSITDVEECEHPDQDLEPTGVWWCIHCAKEVSCVVAHRES